MLLFASGSPLSMSVLRGLRGRCELSAVVAPARPRVRGGPRGLARALLAMWAQRALSAETAAGGVPFLRYQHRKPELIPAKTGSMRPDLTVVASFPFVIPEDCLSISSLGGVGLHLSLLPRHRGPSPLYWTYMDDDRSAGVSLHVLDGEADTGDLIAQEELPLARGRSLRQLYLDLASRGTRLLLDRLEALEARRVPTSPQDPSRATLQPTPAPGLGAMDLTGWRAERVWHVLSGIGERGNVLEDAGGRILAHGRAVRYLPGAPAKPPGTVEPNGRGWLVHCHDGLVEVAGPTPQTRLRRLLRARSFRPPSGAREPTRGGRQSRS